MAPVSNSTTVLIALYKELHTVVQKYTQNIVNNVNEDAFEKCIYSGRDLIWFDEKKKKDGKPKISGSLTKKIL